MLNSTDADLMRLPANPIRLASLIIRLAGSYSKSKKCLLIPAEEARVAILQMHGAGGTGRFVINF